MKILVHRYFSRIVILLLVFSIKLDAKPTNWLSQLIAEPFSVTNNAFAELTQSSSPAKNCAKSSLVATKVKKTAQHFAASCPQKLTALQARVCRLAKESGRLIINHPKTTVGTAALLGGYLLIRHRLAGNVAAWALNHNYQWLMRGAIKCCANINAKRYGLNSDQSLVQLAALNNNEAAVRFLVEHGADINHHNPLSSPLEIAARNTNQTIARYLIDHCADVNRAFNNELNHGQWEQAQFIMKHGANPNCEWAPGLPLINDFISCHNSEAVKFLVTHGARLNPADQEKSPLRRAANTGNLPLVQYLVDQGALVTEQIINYRYFDREISHYLKHAALLQRDQHIQREHLSFYFGNNYIELLKNLGLNICSQCRLKGKINSVELTTLAELYLHQLKNCDQLLEKYPRQELITLYESLSNIKNYAQNKLEKFYNVCRSQWIQPKHHSRYPDISNLLKLIDGTNRVLQKIQKISRDNRLYLSFSTTVYSKSTLHRYLSPVADADLCIQTLQTIELTISRISDRELQDLHKKLATINQNIVIFLGNISKSILLPDNTFLPKLEQIALLCRTLMEQIDQIQRNTISEPHRRSQEQRALKTHLRELGITECPMCLEEIGTRQMTQLPCSHAYCTDCLIQMVDNAIASKSTAEFRCPHPECHRRPLDIKDLRAILGSNSNKIETFSLMAAHEWTEAQQGIRHCPTPDCSFTFINETHNQSPITCDRCHRTYCADCLLNHDRGTTCAQARAEIARTSNATFAKRAAEQWKNNNTTKCPRCSKPIEKNDGCQHMTCRCGYQFCWICLRPWSQNVCAPYKCYSWFPRLNRWRFG